jgi:hypothetical protein
MLRTIAFGICAGMALLGLVACDERLTGDHAQQDLRSVPEILQAVDAGLRSRQAEAVIELALSPAEIASRCSNLDAASQEQARARAVESRDELRRAVVECLELAPWPKLTRGIRASLHHGLNVDRRVCDESWNACGGIARMCKSEMFYFDPDEAVGSYKVSLASIGRVGDRYVLLGPVRCSRKSQ